MQRLVFPLISTYSSHRGKNLVSRCPSSTIMMMAKKGGAAAALVTPSRGQYYPAKHNGGGGAGGGNLLQQQQQPPYPPSNAQRHSNMGAPMGGGGMGMGMPGNIPPELRAPSSSSGSFSSSQRGGGHGLRGESGGPSSSVEGMERMPLSYPPSRGMMNGGGGGEEEQQQSLYRGSSSARPGGHPSTPMEEEEEAFQPPQKPTEPPKFITITEDEGGKRGIYTVSLARPPVNSLHLDLLQELNSWMLWLGSTEEVKAVILTSAIPTVFSAGLDLQELHRPQQERFISFWTAFQETWIILNSFPHPILAAITGNSPSAGCTLAMGCDYRIMARGPRSATPASSSAGAGTSTPPPPPNRQYRIGLNECKLGLVAPAWVMPAYGYLLGSRRAERMLQLGETPTAEEALQLGLIDQVVESDERVMDAAVRMAERFAAIPKPSRWMARNTMRQEYLDMLASEENRHYDTEFFSNLIGSPEVQGSLEAYLERFKQMSRK